MSLVTHLLAHHPGLFLFCWTSGCWHNRLRNDLYCVGWGVKLYSLSHCCSHIFLLQIFPKVIFRSIPPSPPNEAGLNVCPSVPRVGFGAQVWCHCRISPPRFLAECRKRRLNQGSFVVLYFNFSALSDLYLVFACLFSCTVFVFSYCVFIFLYCFVCQYWSSDWLWRPPPKWPILCRVGR